MSENKQCEYSDCTEIADSLVYDRAANTVKDVCDRHAYVILDDTCPEYITSCPNCGCGIPVN